MFRAEAGTVGVGGGDVRVRGCLNVGWGRGRKKREENAPLWEWGSSLGDSRGTSEATQLGGDACSVCFLSSSLSARIPCLWSTAPSPSSSSAPRLSPLLSFSSISPHSLPPASLHLPLPTSLPSISSPFPPPSFLTLPHPTMHHSVLVIHLFHPCFLLLLRGGGCDHRNISEGEEGLNWGEADGGAVSSTAGLAAAGSGATWWSQGWVQEPVCLAGHGLKSCLLPITSS